MRWLILGACWLFACGSEAARPPGGGGAGPEAGPQQAPICRPDAGAPAEEPSPEGWRAPFVLHAVGAADASTLAVERDGTWFWTIAGCDFWNCAGGNWLVDGDDLLLTGLAGRPPLWHGLAAVEVRLRRRGALGVVVRVTGREGEEEWAYGGVCADCCGPGLGPQSTYACRLPRYDAQLWASCTAPGL